MYTTDGGNCCEANEEDCDKEGAVGSSKQLEAMVLQHCVFPAPATPTNSVMEAHGMPPHKALSSLCI